MRWSGRLFERLAARRERRPPRALYHAALEVDLEGVGYAIEQAPAWGPGSRGPGVLREGAVGARALGRLRLFRYEVRCRAGGEIPDAAFAVDGPRALATDPERTARLLAAVAECPAATWGRDELRAGEMWNSNAVVAWLLVRSGHEAASLAPPAGGRAPGWAAGLRVAAR